MLPVFHDGNQISKLVHGYAHIYHIHRTDDYNAQKTKGLSCLVD